MMVFLFLPWDPEYELLFVVQNLDPSVIAQTYTFFLFRRSSYTELLPYIENSFSVEILYSIDLSLQNKQSHWETKRQIIADSAIGVLSGDCQDQASKKNRMSKMQFLESQRPIL